MASTITLKRRITSIKGTRQITKAMQMVSASKLRRAQEYAQRSRAYRDLAYSLLVRLSGMPEVELQPLFRKRAVTNRLHIVVTSSSGLAGAYNANVLKLLTKNIQDDRASGVKSHVITVGSKGAQFVRRLSNVNLLAVYPSLGDHPTANDVQPMLNTIIDQYKDELIDEVQLLYTLFRSTVSQEAMALPLLPASTESVDTSSDLPAGNVFNFEPDVETVVDQVAIRLIEAQLWQAILESLASEHAMRMVAMKNATDNAKDLIDDYTLALNTARQSAITQELAEITGGAEAMTS